MDERTFKVSAVISTYNAEAFIKSRLQNLVDQTLYKKDQLEIIVIDSHSPQNEQAIVKEFQAKYDHITYKRTENRESLYKAWNRGIALMNGEYFINANTDDRFAQNALEQLASALDNDWNADVAFGNWLYTYKENDRFESDSEKFLVTYPDFFPPLFFYFQTTGHACMIRSIIFDELGTFNGNFKVYGDREFMLRFSLRGKKGIHIKKTIGLYLENARGIYNTEGESTSSEINDLLEHYMNRENLPILFGYRSDDKSPTHATLLDYVVSLCNKQLKARGQYYINNELGLELANILQRNNYESARLLNNVGILNYLKGKKRIAKKMITRALQLSLINKDDEILRIADNRKNLKNDIKNPVVYNWISPDKKRFKSYYAKCIKKHNTEKRKRVNKQRAYLQLFETLQKLLNRQNITKARQILEKHRNGVIAKADLGLLSLLLLNENNREKAETHIEQIKWQNITYLELLPLLLNRFKKFKWLDTATKLLDACVEAYLDLPESLLKQWFNHHYKRGAYDYLQVTLYDLESRFPGKIHIVCYLQQVLEKKQKQENGHPGQFKIGSSRNPLVSAIVSTYNAEAYIQKRLDNLLGQTIANELEIIVIDSGSEQNEAAVVKQYQKEYKNIRLIETRRETVYKAWNRGIKAANGEFVTNANTDDQLRLDGLEILTNQLKQNPETDLVYCNVLQTLKKNADFKVENVSGVYNYLDYHPEVLLAGYCIIGPMPVWRKSLHEEIGYFDEEFITSGDFEFWVRAVAQKVDINIKKVNRYLGLYLIRPDSIEHRNQQKKGVENRIILERYDN